MELKTKRRVLVTGASGYLAGKMIPFFREHFELILTDIREVDRQGNKLEGIRLADLRNRDRDSYREIFREIDTVVHFGWVREKTEGVEPFYLDLANVEMAYNIYQTAFEENVRRVVMTSSNHAADYYEELVLDGKMDVVTPETQNRSYGYYGWGKDSYEHLGFVFAVGRANGRPLENIQIRIGNPYETSVENAERGDLRRVRRALAAYISDRDMAQLYIKSIETEDIRDEHGVPFQVFYGISGNSAAFWSLVNARKVVGYAPVDDSSVRFHSQFASHLST